MLVHCLHRRIKASWRITQVDGGGCGPFAGLQDTQRLWDIRVGFGHEGRYAK